MEDQPTPTAAKQESFADIDPDLRPVAEKYGRAMFALVHNAGMAGEATRILTDVVQRHQSKAGLHAVTVIATALNAISNQIALQAGWTAEEIGECQAAIQLAYGKKIVVPGSRILVQ